MSREPASSEQNNILGALSHAYYGKLSAQMESVTLPAGTVLYEVGEPIKHVYFPRTALISLVGLTADGRGTEVAMIGSEGFLGVPVLLGAISQPYEATIQIGGRLWKMRKEVLEGTEPDGPSLTHILHRYATIRVNQISQSAICNRFHTLRQRLCRWLLTAADRTKNNRLDLTQEYLSQMIGARRPATAKTLGLLRRKRFIGAERGRIRILNQTALEAASCECYRSGKQELETFQRSYQGSDH
jgi:CRP-like cAMP-binding protein